MSNIPNLPSSLDASTTRIVANAPLADWDGGMNSGGSCAPGVGINTGGFYDPPTADQWTLEDQAENARIPQLSQFIGGGVGSVATEPSASQNLLAQDYEGADLNNTFAFVIAVGAVAPGAVVDFGAINRSSFTLASGDVIWGVVPVA